MLFFITFIFIFIGFKSTCKAQSDSVKIKANLKSVDSIPLKPKREYIPEKAALYSVILPGLGQVYNRRYWKVPILYAGAATLGYFIYFNNNRFLDFDDSFKAKLNNLPPSQDPYAFLSLESVQLNRTYWRRNRDFLIIVSVLCYGLNIVDALVDAHLRNFDVSDELSLKIEPSIDQIYNQPTVGLSLKLQLKK